MTQENQTALIPMDTEAERRLIGTLILDKERISETMDVIFPDYFYGIHNRYIFESICSLHIDGHPITTETIATNLKGKRDLEKSYFEIVGGANGIIATIQGIGVEEYDYWAGIVRKKYDERKLLEFANEARRLALSSPEDVGKLRAKLEEKLIGLSGTTSASSIGIAAASPELSARIDRYINNPDEIIGLPTTFSRLDESLDGLQPGNVSIVYAPSSRFKSLFATNIGWHLAEQNIPGLWFTTEMPRVQVLERLLQLESGLNLKWLRRDRRVYQYRKDIADAQARIARYPITFCDTSALDVSEIRSEISRHVRWNGIKYVIIDLVDHVSSSRFKDEMVNNQRAVMSAMKQIAKDFSIHILLVSHVAKQSKDTRRDADLDVEAMIGSSAKYQDVDASISIGPVRIDESGRWVAMQREDILSAVASTGIVDVMISVTKNRHGELLRYIIGLNFNQGGRFDERAFFPIVDKKDEQLTFEEE